LLLVVALARPQEGKELLRDSTRGVAVEMVVDKSSSMLQDMQLGDETVPRIEVVKRVFSEFIEGGKELRGRADDLIGMVTFARYATTVCPLTLDHGTLLQYVDKTWCVEPNSSDDGTAIGEGVGLAAARLKNIEKELRRAGEAGDDYEVKSRVLILLTDGEDTVASQIPGTMTPLESADLCKEWGIKIHAIGIGDEQGARVSRDRFMDSFFSRRLGRRSFDPQTLEEMAKRTGGIFRVATDADSLRAVYAEIDAMEKTDISTERYLEYTELFAPFALASFCVLALELLLSWTFFRRIP
jgi:Ca-activated chloride channel family protein